MTKDEALRLALEALTDALNKPMWNRVQMEAAITAIKAALEAKDEPVAWVPYLSDRADGVQGHYAIARWNPRGYREVWNLRRHTWGAFSDDVMSLEEADYLLQQITIPTRKPTPPAQPVIDESTAKRIATTLGWEPKRKPLTDEEIQQIFIANSVVVDNGNAYMVAGLRTVNIARAIEAAHGIKEKKI